MNKTNALSWSSMLMATLLFGVALGFSLGYVTFSAPRPNAPEQAKAKPDEVATTNANSADPEAAVTKMSPETSATPATTRPAPKLEPVPPAAVSQPEVAAATQPAAGDYWAAQHLIIAVNGQWLADSTRTLLRELRPAVVLLQDVNLGSRTQTFALVKEIKAAVGLGDGLGDLPLIAVQQEGGPYNLLGVENAPSAQALGQNGDPELARKLGQQYGEACVGRGIAIAFAPVLDVFEPGAINPGFAVRSFGTDHALVARVGLAMADGLRQGGVLPVIKHFPGYGAATYGSDGLLVALNKDPSGLGRLLYPFDQAVRRGVPGMLVAHVAVPALDPENPRRPAALSPVLVGELLRARWGYEGVIVADDVALNSMTRSMGAEAASVQALAAGCDLVMMLDPDPAKIRAVSAAIGAAAQRGDLDKAKLEASAARFKRWQEAIGNLNAVRAAPATAPLEVAEAAPMPALTIEAPAQSAAQPPIQTGPEPATLQPAEPGPVSVPETPAGASRIEYTVRAGETLEKIGQDYGVSASDIVKWNSLPSNAVSAGTTLAIYLSEPAAGAETAPDPSADQTPTEPPAVETGTAAQPANPPSLRAGFAGKAAHTVAEGDTLAKIAEKYGVDSADIKLWNGLESEALEAGKVLTIFLGSAAPEISTAAPAPETPAAEAPKPEASAPAPAPPAEAAPQESPPTAPAIEVQTEAYVVKAGDTMSKISRAYKTSVDELLTLNGLKDGNQIVVGQTLKVPAPAH